MIEVIEAICYSFRHISKVSKWYILLAIISSVLTGLYNILMTYMVRIIISNIETSNSQKFIQTIGILVMISTIIFFINAYCQNYFLPKLNLDIDNYIQKEIYEKNIKTSLNATLDSGYYDSYYFSLVNGKESIKGVIGVVSSLLSNMIGIIGIMAIFLNYDVYSLIIVFIGVFLSFVLSTMSEKKKYEMKLLSIPENRKIDYVGRIMYQPDFSKEIRSNNSEIFFFKLKYAFSNVKNIISENGKSISNLTFFSNFSSGISVLLVVLILGLFCISGKFEVSIFMMLYTGINQINGELTTFFSNFPQLYMNALNITRHREFLEKSWDDEDTEQVCNRLGKVHKIELKNVSFGYKGKNILNNISIIFDESSKKIGIIGSNGSGKSTLVSVIMGLYKQNSGEIFINDMDINLIDNRRRMEMFSVVYQDFKIYSMSIIENICMKYDIMENDINKVDEILKKVGLYEKVKSLKNGVYEVLTSEFEDDSSGLSLGELQKVAIARAYFKNSDVIVLDEPSSFGDSSTRNNLISLIDRLSEDRFVILITHDNSYLSHMDKVIKVENGNVIEV
ncbi:TPA: ABC transporter ATP-binding protein [Streptococcus suis]|uniref:ATP-binding cassette domain-containing protein n=1 Tax=Streptococcus suis TaxID=1307 RepID=UPI00155509F1|nr:ABC transporter ATP-binding protein [Streptococcus suis]MCK3906053.1 ABC transporter ATP-binding protein [Streptococcus suis]NQR01215.1 ABC transporter ATP-binding protein [Streptococcus suis]NQR72770.1 ABC transporter ATP-binding protein [Streptococcus suis]NQS32910.1 ABC transporter ATP-binding protein [Streptococcus suis]HEM5621387.1 ABC transporter ATP-binding protein [Streptococcus suis]